MSIEKHEQQTWEKLHVEQELMRKKLFSENEMVITSKEYHKRLSKMHQLGRSSMPGDLKPGDTLATLQCANRSKAVRKTPWRYMLETKDGHLAVLSSCFQAASKLRREAKGLQGGLWLQREGRGPQKP